MAANRFYKVRIDTIHLSKDGSDATTYCKTLIDGATIGLLKQDKFGNYDTNADGSTFDHVMDVKGVEIKIRVAKLLKPVFDDLAEFLNDANSSRAEFEVQITSQTLNKTLSCKTLLRGFLVPSGFVNNYIKDVEINLITA